MSVSSYFFFFFFNDTATTEIYTLSLHDALPIALERRDHLARRLEAIARLLLEAAQDDVGQFARHLRIHVRGGRRRVRDVLADDLLRRIAVERRAARHHPDEYAAQRAELRPRA